MSVDGFDISSFFSLEHERSLNLQGGGTLTNYRDSGQELSLVFGGETSLIRDTVCRELE